MGSEGISYKEPVESDGKLSFKKNFFFFFGLFAFSRAAPTPYGGSQARGLIGAKAARPTPELQQRGIRAASTTYITAHP